VEVIEQQWAEHERLRAANRIVPYVFHYRGGPIGTIAVGWNAAAKRAGCPGRIPHDLRRTAVRNLVAAGIPEKTAMLLTGHRTRSVFDRYHIVSEPDLRAAVAKLATVTVSGQSAHMRAHGPTDPSA
jgi:integrase